MLVPRRAALLIVRAIGDSQMKAIDIDLERARRALDGSEAYPGELIETVIVGLE